MARLLGHDPGRRDRRRRLTRRGRYFAPASANWASSWAARKYLFLPRSPTVLMLKACLSRSASPSLTPCSALTGALRTSARGLLSHSLSRNASRLASTAMAILRVAGSDRDASVALTSAGGDRRGPAT